MEDKEKYNEEKEEYVEDNYTKKSTFVDKKPNIKQFFDTKKLLLILIFLIILSVIFAITLKPQKKEEKATGNVNIASKNTLDITEETQQTPPILEEIEEPISTEVPDLDKYDSMLGSQYEDNESFDMNFTPITEENMSNGKGYRRSEISFKKQKNTTDNQSTQTANVSLTPEQQALLTQQQNNQNQVIDTSQNRQESKQKFLDTKRNKSFYSTNTTTPALSKYEIKAGSMIEAVLLTSINSDLPGEILAQVTRDIRDFRTLKHTLIPKGSRIIGRYDSNITYGQNRLLVVWDRIIFPNGNSLALDNYQGVDLLGNAGLKGKVNNHFWKLLRSVVLSAGINMAAGRLEDVNVNINSSDRARVTLGTGANNMAQNIENIGSRMIEKDLNQQPTIQIKRGARFNIFVNTDMILPVYKQ